MDTSFISLHDQHQALATEALGFDAGLVASIEQFSALGIDVLALQADPFEDETGRSMPQP
jgi:hypothetical protein